jgi:integrase
VFPGRLTGKPLDAGPALKRKLVRHGAPVDFYPHAVRHTVATFLKMQGYSEWDRGLVLNHAESGVTAGYSHGYALERKRELLERWAEHVASIIA